MDVYIRSMRKLYYAIYITNGWLLTSRWRPVSPSIRQSFQRRSFKARPKHKSHLFRSKNNAKAVLCYIYHQRNATYKLVVTFRKPYFQTATRPEDKSHLFQLTVMCFSPPMLLWTKSKLFWAKYLSRTFKTLPLMHLGYCSL
jgi:hypothetical protein